MKKYNRLELTNLSEMPESLKIESSNTVNNWQILITALTTNNFEKSNQDRILQLPVVYSFTWPIFLIDTSPGVHKIE